MKMKVPVVASTSGKVSRILVAAGDAVTAGQPLITLS
jgi:biotin carboxyl carrier protein